MFNHSFIFLMKISSLDKQPSYLSHPRLQAMACVLICTGRAVLYIQVTLAFDFENIFPIDNLVCELIL